ncbi:MAG: hypothetical protein Tsb002_33990 [Wenzhouxiangellaceae bacterium]
MAARKKSASRFDRVRQILNDAQGDHIPDYQGYRAFWQDIETFQSARLYGQWMIAPANHGGSPTSSNDSDQQGNSCCGGGAGKNPNAMAGSSAGLGSGPAVDAVNIEPTLPVNAPDCWPTGDDSHSGHGPGDTSRSDRSGIIIGLRGQAPFDGTIFPPLLWNAAYPVSESDIAFIAAWIDDGCPVDDATTDDQPAAPASNAIVAGQVHAGRDDIQALACGDMAHQVSGQCTNHEMAQRDGLHVRKEVSSLTAEELQRLREALACMYQYNGYWLDERSFDFWARIHTNSCQHGWEQFLPWHRLYLYFFEQTLQDYDPLITLPYWSWPDYADANRDTYQTEQLDLGVIPEAYRCWLTEAAVEQLQDTGLYSKKQLNGLYKVAKSGETFNSGPRLLKAAGVPYTLAKAPKTGEAIWSDATRAIYNQCRRLNPLWFPNRWPGSIGSPTHYPTKENVDQLLAIPNWPDFGGGPSEDHHFGALEQMHNGMHNFAGGVNPFFDEAKKLGIESPDPQNFENPQFGWMTDNRVTAYDPIFWGHHANVDRVWARWQELHPGVEPSDLDGSQPPWSLTIGDALSTRKLGYEYMRDSFHYPTTQGVGISRFKGAEAGVSQKVLDTHRKAEVRLHRVRRANIPNCYIRVFLNTPDADAATPMQGNPNFVGAISTFHGSCFGGPQHCALPLPRNRNNDLRPLHHHQPRNFRLDATQCVQSLCADGASDLSVHLVVTGLDGKPVDNALFIDGVSLNFMD